MFVSFKHIFCSILITNRILPPGFKDQMKGMDLWIVPNQHFPKPLNDLLWKTSKEGEKNLLCYFVSIFHPSQGKDISVKLPLLIQWVSIFTKTTPICLLNGNFHLF